MLLGFGGGPLFFSRWVHCWSRYRGRRTTMLYIAFAVPTAGAAAIKFCTGNSSDIIVPQTGVQTAAAAQALMMAHTTTSAVCFYTQLASSSSDSGMSGKRKASTTAVMHAAAPAAPTLCRLLFVNWSLSHDYSLDPAHPARPSHVWSRPCSPSHVPTGCTV